VRRELSALDRRLPIRLQLVSERLDAGIADPALQALIYGLFGLLALALLGIGIYGVMSYAVTQRTHEIGVRMALGAEAGEVNRMVVRQALVPVGIGLAIGLPGAFGFTRLFGSLLYEIGPNDPATMIAVSLILVAVSAAAAYLPVRRASSVDPLVALRYE